MTYDLGDRFPGGSRFSWQLSWAEVLLGGSCSVGSCPG